MTSEAVWYILSELVVCQSVDSADRFVRSWRRWRVQAGRWPEHHSVSIHRRQTCRWSCEAPCHRSCIHRPAHAPFRQISTPPVAPDPWTPKYILPIPCGLLRYLTVWHGLHVGLVRLWSDIYFIWHFSILPGGVSFGGSWEGVTE